MAWSLGFVGVGESRPKAQKLEAQTWVLQKKFLGKACKTAVRLLVSIPPTPDLSLSIGTPKEPVNPYTAVTPKP